MLRIRMLAGAIAAGLIASTAAAADFSKVVVIGDSLSDAGNISLATAPTIQPPLRFTTNPGMTAAERVAAALGHPATPSLAGGTDYAFGGAGLVHNSAAGPIPTLPQQLAMYLGANGGKADPSALYQVWGGANDIFYLTATTSDATALAVGTATAAQTEAGLLGQLQAAGARYVVVYNLPDIGKTPQALAGGAAASAGATQLSVIYNSTLDAGVAKLGLNVIPVNTFALINEVVANPAAFGFSNVTAPACGVGATSVLCGPQGAGLPYSYAPGTNQSYLFADGVHPTDAAHAMVAQVVLSELAAPGQVSLLGEAPLAATAAQFRAVRNQMLADREGSDTRMFVNADYGQQHFDNSGGAPKTDSDNINLTIGADVRANENFSFGVALSAGRNNADFAHGGGGYRMDDITGLGYAFYHRGGGYLGAFASYGQSNFKDIDRRFWIGPLRRTESGKADGSHLGGGLEGGWWFRLGDSIETGPFAHAEWQTVKVDGYTEGGSDSTTMWFGRQQRDALIEQAGWRLKGTWQLNELVMSPYAEVSWNHDEKADPRGIKAGVAGMSGHFVLPGFAPDSTWARADIGLVTQLTSNVTGWIAYSSTFSNDSQREHNVNMGMKVAF